MNRYTDVVAGLEAALVTENSREDLDSVESPSSSEVASSAVSTSASPSIDPITRDSSPIPELALPSARPSHAVITKHAVDMIRREAAAVLALASRLEAGDLGAAGFSAAVDLLADAHEHSKLIVTGLGKSAIVGRKAVATMCSLGYQAVFVDPVAALHGDIGVISPSGFDVALVISYSGRTAELMRLLPTLQARCKGGLIALTGDPSAPLSRAADAWLDGRLHDGAEADADVPAPSASVLVALSQLDALALAVLRLRVAGGWAAPGSDRAAQFAYHHEGGQLGIRLKANNTVAHP